MLGLVIRGWAWAWAIYNRSSIMANWLYSFYQGVKETRTI